MRVLYYLNSNWRKFFDLHSLQPVISFNEFINTKLTAKATRQLQGNFILNSLDYIRGVFQFNYDVICTKTSSITQSILALVPQNMEILNTSKGR